MTEGAKEKVKAKIEVGVVVPTEGVTVITKGVAIMRRTRAPPGMAIRVAKGVKATATKVARVTIIKEARVTTNHPTSLRSTLTRTNSQDMVSNTKIRLETRVEMTKGDMAIVEVVIAALGEDSLALPVLGVMGSSTIYMGSATGRTIVSQNLYAKRVAALMLSRDVPGTSHWSIRITRVIRRGILVIIHLNRSVNLKEVGLEMVREVRKLLS